VSNGPAVVRTTVLIPSPAAIVWAAAQGGMRDLPGYGPVRVVLAEPPAGARGRVVAVGGRCGLVWTRWVVPTAAGVSVTDELRWSSGRLWPVLDPVRRHRLLRLLESRTAALRAAVSGSDPAMSTVDGPLVVVGAALLDGGGRVLAAQRAQPPALAGRWEFPGGKVEPGETDEAALRRECDEELGVRVELGDRLGVDVPVQGGHGVLRVWTGRIVAGDPAAREHASLRWLAAGELDDVDWLPADRPLVEQLKSLLAT
jgi:8-oxo-dGTP diphosphatase